MPMPVTIETTPIGGLLIVKTGDFHDDRGFFSESYSRDMWAEAGFAETFVQDNLSKSKKGTLRGMHYQEAPGRETKLVSCIRGAIHDVVVDLRPGSSTFAQWIGIDLTEANQRQIYVPEGFAHGFQTLCDDVVVSYLISAFHAPELARGVRYDDPAIGIEWPMPPTVMSERDLGWPWIAQDEAGRPPIPAQADGVP